MDVFACLFEILYLACKDKCYTIYHNIEIWMQADLDPFGRVREGLVGYYPDLFHIYPGIFIVVCNIFRDQYLEVKK